MDSMLYPTYVFVEGRGLLPNVRLPRNFRQLVPKFYEERRREGVEEFANNVGAGYLKSGKPLDIRLNWDDTRGLTNLSLGIHAGLDLEDNFGWPSFQEHNLGGDISFVAAAIAQKYVSELIKAGE